MTIVRAGRRRERAAALCAAVTVAALLSGCAAHDDPAVTPEPAAPARGAEPSALPSSHVHAVAVNPADDRVHLATHEGLFRFDATGPTRVGPVIDLMGFSVAGPDHFYASGHPGAGTDLPEPVGLIESLDGGATWVPLSRAGESDFHALAATSAGVVGFDGTLMASADGQTWTTLEPPVETFALAASPDGSILVATSPQGPARSVDGGGTWTVLEAAPLLQVVDWADGDTVVGVTPDGAVAVSTDGGATWDSRGDTGGPPQAVGASARADGSVRVIVVTADAIVESHDGAETFVALEVS